jgi:hypothetical protein
MIPDRGFGFTIPSIGVGPASEEGLVDGENGGVIDALIYESASQRMPNSTPAWPSSPNPAGARMRREASVGAG